MIDFHWSQRARALTCIGSCAVIIAACASKKNAIDSTDQLLAGAQRAIGTASDSVRTIWAVANVTTSGKPFVTRVASARDGRVRMTLGSSLIAGVNHKQGWSCDTSANVGALDSVTRTVVRGHDLHMMALSPGTWLSNATLQPPTRWGADSVMSVEFKDELGAPLILYLRTTDTLPVGAHVINHTDAGPRDVAVFFSEWEQRNGLRLFRKAVFVHGDNRFEYDYAELTVNSLADSVFTPGCGSPK